MFNIPENKPLGATKEMVMVTPIMEQFNDYHEQGLRCSIDSDSLAVPFGARNYFDRHGYMIIENLYDPKELYSDVPTERGQIGYYGSMESSVHNPTEMQVPGSLARYSHPQYKEAHTKIRLILEDILGEKLYNTYYYDRFYFTGQRLARHTDRDACEISVSIQISTNSFSPWPFCIETAEGKEIFVNIKNGSAILYKGCERDHWREPLQSRYTKFGRLLNKIIGKEEDTYHHQIFFHYVRANGPRAHFAKDSSF